MRNQLALLAVVVLSAGVVMGEEGLPGGLEKADSAEKAAEKKVVTAAAPTWTPSTMEKDLYALATKTLALAKASPTSLEADIEAYKAEERMEFSSYGLAQAQLEAASQKYADAARKAISLEMKERKLRMHVMHSKLMKRVLETKLAASENRLGDDLVLKPGQSFGFTMAQRKALAVHGVTLNAVLTAQHTVTSDSTVYAFTAQQQSQLKLKGLDKASIAKAEAALNAHIARSAQHDVPGWNGEEVALLQEEDGVGATSAVTEALNGESTVSLNGDDSTLPRSEEEEIRMLIDGDPMGDGRGFIKLAATEKAFETKQPLGDALRKGYFEKRARAEKKTSKRKARRKEKRAVKRAVRKTARKEKFTSRWEEKKEEKVKLNAKTAIERIEQKVLGRYAVVAEIDGKVVGFGAKKKAATSSNPKRKTRQQKEKHAMKKLAMRSVMKAEKKAEKKAAKSSNPKPKAKKAAVAIQSSAMKRTSLVPKLNAKDEVEMLEAYLSRESLVKTELARSQKKANTLARQVLTAEHQARLQFENEKTKEVTAANKQKSLKDVRAKAEVALHAITAVKSAIASVEQAQEATQSNGQHLVEVEGSIPKAEANVKAAEDTMVTVLTAYEKGRLAYTHSASYRASDAKQTKGVKASITELTKMIDRAQQGLIMLSHRPREVSEVMRNANLQLVKMENVAKAMPRDVISVSKLKNAYWKHRETASFNENRYTKRQISIDKLRNLRNDLRTMLMRAELVGKVEAGKVDLGGAQLIMISHLKAMNAEEDAASAHYTLSALKQTQTMITHAMGKADEALKEAVKYLEGTLSRSKVARKAHKAASVDAKALLEKARVANIKHKLMTQQLIAHLDRRIHERSLEPFASKDPLIDPDENALSDFVKMSGKEFSLVSNEKRAGSNAYSNP